MKPRTSTRAMVSALAAKMGVKVFEFYNAQVVGVQLEAPPRKLFRCNHRHTAAITLFRCNGASAKVYGMAIEDLKAGLYDCEVSDCEWCTRKPELEASDEEGDDPDLW